MIPTGRVVRRDPAKLSCIDPEDGLQDRRKVRCRLIDLGAWLSGDRAIPGEPVDPDELPPVDPGTADEREPPRGPGLRDETRGRSPQGSRRR